MLGTTQFVNAAIQLQGLARVVLVRLCGPATHALPPFCDMPPRLRAAIGGCYFLAEGEPARAAVPGAGCGRWVTAAPLHLSGPACMTSQEDSP